MKKEITIVSIILLIIMILLINNKSKPDNNEYNVYYKVNLGYIDESKKEELNKTYKDLTCNYDSKVTIDNIKYIQCTGTLLENSYKPGTKVNIINYKYKDYIGDNIMEYKYQSKWLYNKDNNEDISELNFKYKDEEDSQVFIKYAEYNLSEELEEELYEVYSKNHTNTYDTSLINIIETCMEENLKYKDLISKDINTFIMPNHDVYLVYTNAD